MTSLVQQVRVNWIRLTVQSTTLRAELIVLRTGRTTRRAPRREPAPRIREPRYLDERPAESRAA